MSDGVASLWFRRPCSCPPTTQSPEGSTPLGVCVTQRLLCITGHRRAFFVSPSQATNCWVFLANIRLSEMLCGQCCRDGKGLSPLVESEQWQVSSVDAWKRMWRSELETRGPAGSGSRIHWRSEGLAR